MIKCNEKVERFAPKLGRKNLANGLSCPPFVYMEDSDDGMWVHYVKYCENIAKQKFKRCVAMAKWCCEAYDKWMMKKAKAIGLGKDGVEEYHQARRKLFHYMRWQKRWLELAEKFKEAK